MATKYSRYLIQITYMNGNKETIEYFNNKHVNTSSYKEMMEVYKNIKEEYSNKSVLIDFVGQTEDEQLSILFTKKIKQEKLEDKTTFELVEDLNNIVNTLKVKAQQAKDIYCLVEKEKSVYEHKSIEFIDVIEISEKEKARRFDEFRSILLRRREAKNELSNVQSIKVELDLIHNNTKKIFNRTFGYIEKITKTTECSINNTIPSELDKQCIREYPYRTEKERLSLIRQLNHKYDRIIAIPEEKILKCYNKSKRII